MADFEHSGEPAEGAAAEDQLYRIRHSLSHVLAQAVLEMRPGSTLGFGPPIKYGFYYDFILSEPLTEGDFPELERRMKNETEPIGRRRVQSREDLVSARAVVRHDVVIRGCAKR